MKKKKKKIYEGDTESQNRGKGTKRETAKQIRKMLVQRHAGTCLDTDTARQIGRCWFRDMPEHA